MNASASAASARSGGADPAAAADGLAAVASPLRLAIVTNIPAPYRVPVYDRIAASPGIDLCVFYAARSEPGRDWDLPPLEHAHLFLHGRTIVHAGRAIHFNPSIGSALARFSPDVVLTTGYNPTHLLAWLHALLGRRRHVAMTDGTESSEAGLGVAHRIVRRMVLATTPACVVASVGGWRLLRRYGVDDERIHFSPLCANPAVDWNAEGDRPRDIDLLFSGSLVARKNAAFALDVAQGVALRLARRVRFAVLGSGPLESELRARAARLAPGVDVVFAGPVLQAAMPLWFRRARLFVFPTLADAWGVVANEACSAGVPVLVSPHAGVAGELVRDGVNGLVLPLQQERWIDGATRILGDAACHARMAAAALQQVRPYSAENAAAGIVDAAVQARTGNAAARRLSNFPRPPPPTAAP